MERKLTELQQAQKKGVEDLLLSTKIEGIENLIEYLEMSDFYYAPASTRFHGSWAGGLAAHALNVYNALLFEYSNLADADFNLPKISEESLIIVGICHDLCKIGLYHEGFRWTKEPPENQWVKIPTFERNPELPMGHGAKSVYILNKFISLSDMEAQAIFWHMGAYDLSNYMTMNDLSSAYESNLLAYLLNKADMTATYIMENESYKEI